MISLQNNNTMTPKQENLTVKLSWAIIILAIKSLRFLTCKLIVILSKTPKKNQIICFLCGFSFKEHSRFTGQQGKVKSISLIPLYHFHPLHIHLDISRAITGGSSLLHRNSNRTRTGTFDFRAQVSNHKVTSCP